VHYIQRRRYHFESGWWG